MKSAEVRWVPSNQTILSMVGEGHRQPSAGRALLLLRQILPAQEGPVLDAWTVGRRDACLLDVHTATFGEQITGLAACSRCGESLDIAFDAEDIRQPYGDPEEEFVIADPPGYEVQFHLPSCGDLVAAAACADSQAGRRLLADRCVLAASRDGVSVSGSALPDDVITRMGEVMAAHDPQSDIRLAMTCPACGHAWEAVFDIADFLWREMTERARHLIADVHSLARAYGWAEAEILRMPDGRRLMYLDLLSE